jgi:hypothetical protein
MAFKIETIDLNAYQLLRDYDEEGTSYILTLDDDGGKFEVCEL